MHIYIYIYLYTCVYIYFLNVYTNISLLCIYNITQCTYVYYIYTLNYTYDGSPAEALSGAYLQEHVTFAQPPGRKVSVPVEPLIRMLLGSSSSSFLGVEHLLVGGLEHLAYFSIYWECHHPTDFSEGWLNHQPVTFGM